ncbi:MAG: GNAT family N-acetyltransferase [Rhizobacter sp.]
MADTQPPFTIQHDEAHHRFETHVDGHQGVVDYELDGPVMRIVHTVVHPALEGRGIAAALIKSTLQHARSHGLKVDPQCPYARAYMERHPDTKDLRT